MVMRESQSVQTDGVQIRAPEGRVGAAPVRIETRNAENVVQVQSPMSGVVQSIAANLGRIGEQMFISKTEEEYLNGAAQVGTAANEDAIQANWLTRDWAVAGYRDTVGKIALADHEASLISEAQRLSTKPPQDFLSEIQKQRAAILPSFSGMSANGRSVALANLLHSEEVAIKQHGTAYQLHVRDMYQQSIQTQIKTALNTLDTARNDPNPEVMNAAVDGVVGRLYAITNDERLQPKVRQSLAYEAMAELMQRGHFGVYTSMQATRKDSQGNDVRMLDIFDVENQTKLSELYARKRDEVATTELLDYQTRAAKMEAQVRNAEELGVPNYDEYRAMLDEGVTKGHIKPSHRLSALTNWEAANQRFGEVTSSMGLYVQGQRTELLARGGDPAKQNEVFTKRTARERGPVAAFEENMRLLNQYGYPEAGKTAGALASQFIGPMSMGNYTPDALGEQFAATFFTNLTELRRGANSAAAHYVMAGLPPEVAQYSRYVEQRMGQGMDVRQATVAARDDLLTWRNAPKAQKDAASSAAWQEDREFIQKELSRPADVVDRLLSLVPGTAEWDLWKSGIGSLQVNKQLGGFATGEMNTARQHMQNNIVAELTTELQYATPNLSQSARLGEARDNLLRRMIPVGDGVIVAPRGSDINTIFGLSVAAAKDVTAKNLGEALDRLMPLPDKVARVWEFNANGNLTYTDYEGNYGAVRHRIPGAPTELDPKAVGRLAVDIFQAEQARKAAVATGTQYNGVEITGKNTAGIAPEVMLKLRRTLIDQEGVVRNVRELTNFAGDPVQIAGVSVSNRNQYFPTGLRVGDEVPQTSINSSFHLASDDAAKIAQDVMLKNRISNSESAVFLGSLAYHAGSSIKSGTYLESFRAAQSGNAQLAMELFKQTPAYKDAGDPKHPQIPTTRQSWYLAQLNQLR